MTMVQPAIKKHDFPMLIGDEPVRTPKVRTINLPYDGTPVADVYDALAFAFQRSDTRCAARCR